MQLTEFTRELDWSFLASALVASSFLAVLAKSIHEIYFSPLARFPGPKLWKISNLFQAHKKWYGDDAHMKRSLHAKYGSVVRVGPNELIFDTAQAWKDIYGHKSGGKKNFPKDKDFYFPPVNGAHSIVTAGDADHSRGRRILSHAFSDRALKEQQDILEHYTAKLVEQLSNASSSADAIDMVKMWNCATFDIMADLTFGESLHMLETTEYVPWVKTIFGGVKQATRLSLLGNVPGLTRLLMLVAGRVILSMQLEHFRYSSDRVDKRLKNSPARPDFWSQILKRQGGDGLSLPEMHSNGELFMLAGTETTATLLSGLCYLLLKNPTHMKRLVEEIRSSHPAEGLFTIEALQSDMPFLNACINEGLRMYPPLPIGMQRVVPDGGAAINGEWVPGGVAVSVTQLAANYSPKNFYLPDEFIPERWMGQDPRFEKDVRDACQPFSTGPRNCIGRNLALHEARILLAEVLYKFDLELDSRSESWTTQETYRIWEKPPLWLKLRPVTQRS